jgi:hypothetical protein
MFALHKSISKSLVENSLLSSGQVQAVGAYSSSPWPAREKQPDDDTCAAFFSGSAGFAFMVAVEAPTYGTPPPGTAPLQYTDTRARALYRSKGPCDPTVSAVGGWSDERAVDESVVAHDGDMG